MQSAIKKVKEILSTNGFKILINSIASILIFASAIYLMPALRSVLSSDDGVSFLLFILSILIIIISLKCLFSKKLLLDIISSGNILVEDGKIVKIMEEDKIFWRFTRPKNITFFPYSETIFCMQSKVCPISANPKIREFSYTVNIKGISKRDALQKFFKFLGEYYSKSYLKGFYGAWNTFRDKKRLEIQSLLYEFNEQQSVELAKLYNPLSEEQQKTFFQMICSFLNPLLDDYGLRVSNATFQI